MLSIVCVRLPCPTPMAGLELTPEIVLRRADGNTTSEDFPESNLLDGCFIAYKWLVVVKFEPPFCSHNSSIVLSFFFCCIIVLFFYFLDLVVRFICLLLIVLSL